MTRIFNLEPDTRTKRTPLKGGVLSVRSGMSRGQNGHVRDLSGLPKVKSNTYGKPPFFFADNSPDFLDVCPVQPGQSVLSASKTVRR
jgi:hypothetical protein